MQAFRYFFIAISMVFVSCAVAHADTIDFKLDELVAKGRSSCEGNFELLDRAVQRFDFNSDGEFDLVVLDESGFYCKEFVSNYCGSAGCLVHFITPVDYMNWRTQGWKLERNEAGQPIISFGLHGSYCGQAGARTCYDEISILEGRFVANDK